jgi:hypothetical protein
MKCLPAGENASLLMSTRASSLESLRAFLKNAIKRLANSKFLSLESALIYAASIE